MKVTTASVKYCTCCRIGTEVGYGSETLKEGFLLLLTHHFVLFSGGCNAFSGEFEKNDQGSTFSLVQININKYIYKYILYILLIFVQFLYITLM